jgi:hypothetical protein
LKEEDRKDEVIKVNEEERSSEEEVIRRMMMTTVSPSFLPILLLTTSLPPSSSLLLSHLALLFLLPLSLLPLPPTHCLSSLIPLHPLRMRARKEGERQ